MDMKIVDNKIIWKDIEVAEIYESHVIGLVNLNDFKKDFIKNIENLAKLNGLINLMLEVAQNEDDNLAIDLLENWYNGDQETIKQLDTYINNSQEN